MTRKETKRGIWIGYLMVTFSGLGYLLASLVGWESEARPLAIIVSSMALFVYFQASIVSYLQVMEDRIVSRVLSGSDRKPE